MLSKGGKGFFSSVLSIHSTWLVRLPECQQSRLLLIREVCEIALRLQKCFHCNCETNGLPGKPIRRLPSEITVSSTSPTSDIYNTLAQKSGHSVHRLRITKGGDGSLLSNGSETIQETGLKAQSVVYVKDLGAKPMVPRCCLTQY